ncbi:immunity protein Imm33 domain-containing protein [Coralliovum pocilloporae]|uniref:immunity protein Imm33 domain-containing protein n=1 Tax=Coralliovum pocilloporae TaxID=3066369 RepID=UPI003306B354
MIEISSLDPGIGYVTCGFGSIYGVEYKFEVKSIEFLLYCRDIAEYISSYIQNGNKISHNETVNLGMWSLIAKRMGGYISFYEYNDDVNDYVPGINTSAGVWGEQRRFCDEHKLLFCPPRPDQLIVITPNALSGKICEGARYSSEDHMSGWWILSDDYDEGDTSNLRLIHPLHLSIRSINFTKYLAMPEGYCFDERSGEIFFDESVL